MRVLTVFVTLVLLNGCLDERPIVYTNPVVLPEQPALSPQQTPDCIPGRGAQPKFRQLTQIINQTRRGTPVGCNAVPELEVAISGTGARFRALTVEVNYTFENEPLDWDYAVSMGIATRTDTGLSIVGDGRTGDGILTIQGEEYLFTIEDDPICETSNAGREYLDCDGYRISSTTRNAHGRDNSDIYVDWIWYGNDDTTVVTWEIAFWQYSSANEDPVIITDEDTVAYRRAIRMVDNMNEILSRSGVYAQFELKYVVESSFPNDLTQIRGVAKETTPDVDIAAFYGISYSGTCGVAYPGRAFGKQNPKAHLSRCGSDTLLHEIGHSLGLAHGPNNSSNKMNGYIYPDFGHGNENQCGNNSTIMSYGSKRNFLSSTDLLCSDVVDDGYDTPSGDRNITDEAHALNKIRYMVAMINDENRWEVWESPEIDMDVQEETVLID